MKVAIHQNKEIFHHSTNWNTSWIEYCAKNGIEYSVLNCFDNNIIEVLKGYDCLLWHFNNYSLQEMLFARGILYSAKNMGLKVFPDYPTSWHFDDKVAETYLLSSAGAPMPQFWVFYSMNDFMQWESMGCNYPIVAKLRCGSGSGNVTLLNNKRQAVSYAGRMFHHGLTTGPKVLLKTKSNIKSSRDFNTVLKRLKRIPDFLETINKSKEFPKEKGYVYLQEYIPNDGFDLKIAVIGDKLSFIARNVRSGDFRASGGGSLYFDKSLVSQDILQSAFHISDQIGFQCMGYDYVIDNRNKAGKIVEMSYGFSHSALMQAKGYWDREGNWHEEPLNAAEEVLKNLLI